MYSVLLDFYFFLVLINLPIIESTKNTKLYDKVEIVKYAEQSNVYLSCCMMYLSYFILFKLFIKMNTKKSFNCRYKIIYLFPKIIIYSLF